MGAAAEKYPYTSYRDQWKRFAQAIVDTAPDARFCGPSVHNNSDWVQRFLADFGKSNHVSLVTAHLYPGGAGGKVPTPEIGRDRMLSDDFHKVYRKLHDGSLPSAKANGLPYRLEEVNNYFNGGAADVSDRFVAALWGLDFMHWWASHDAAGVNFHTGDRVAAGSNLRPSKYTAFFSTTNGYAVRPLGYGIKAFALGSVGRIVPVKVSAAADLNLTAYGVLAPDDTLFVTLINKEHGPDARTAVARLDVKERSAEAIFLSAPENDVSSASATLGGARIESDGSWNGVWTPLGKAGDTGSLTLRLSPATAAVVKLKASNLAHVFLLDARYIQTVRECIRSGDKRYSAALNSLEGDARSALKAGPFSVMSKDRLPPSGNKHDFMSQAPYYWADPKSADGLPYVRRDGERNPEIYKLTDRSNLGRMIGAVETLALAYYFTTNEAYAAKAAALLRTWFLDPATRMNPNFQFAQAVPGENTGRGTGLIETAGLTSLVDSVGLLAGSRSWAETDQSGMRQWFSQFLQWMIESQNGRAESAARNNHGSYYDLQVVCYSLFVGQVEKAREALEAVKSKRVARQIEPDGRQPLELERTKAWGYSLFNLRALMSLAEVGERVGVDLWHYETPDGRSIRKALDYLIPFAVKEKQWPYKQLGGFSGGDLTSCLRRAARAYPDSSYKTVLAKFKEPSPSDRSNLLRPAI
jgi:hypothetical protein